MGIAKTLFSLLKHRKEIAKALKSGNISFENGLLVVNKMDIALAGYMSAEVWEEKEVVKAILSGDKDKEEYLRKGLMEKILKGFVPERELILETGGCNTWFAEGATQGLDVFLGYATQQQYHYFLVGVNDVTPAEGWTLGTGGTKIRTTFGEFTSYSESVRQTFTFSAAASKAITNSANPAKITCNGSGTLRGACLVSKNPKDGSSDNSGYAVAGKRFTSDLPAATSTEVNMTHTLSGTIA